MKVVLHSHLYDTKFSLRFLYFYLLIVATIIQIGCSNISSQTKSIKENYNYNDGKISSQKNNDEELFNQTFLKFKKALKEKNQQNLMNCFNFPLQTTPQFSNEEFELKPNFLTEQLMGKKEFATYKEDIFTPEVIKILLHYKLSEAIIIDKHTKDAYYIPLFKKVDNSSNLFDIQNQYPQNNGQETSFGFVFGKIGENYKIISYYRPWPLK
jgi:hypothetical protein